MNPPRDSVGIMQPYFFPYLGHFALIASVREWIVFDVTQYTPKTWMNRNRILHPGGGWQYVTVPLSRSSISIKTWQAEVLNLAQTQDNLLGKLSHYKRKAPYFDAVHALVVEVFEALQDDGLVGLNVATLQAVCRYLDLPFHYRICSALQLPFSAHPEAGEWALEICENLGFRHYINPAGGRALFSPERYAAHGVALSFAHFSRFDYDTGPYVFEPDLSILDVLMWNSPEKVVEAIRRGVTIEQVGCP